jgi:hypothetical protein
MHADPRSRRHRAWAFVCAATLLLAWQGDIGLAAARTVFATGADTFRSPGQSAIARVHPRSHRTRVSVPGDPFLPPWVIPSVVEDALVSENGLSVVDMAANNRDPTPDEVVMRFWSATRPTPVEIRWRDLHGLGANSPLRIGWYTNATFERGGWLKLVTTDDVAFRFDPYTGQMKSDQLHHE